MTEETVDGLSLEPERYELQEEIIDHWEAARREFFNFVGEGGVVVVFALDSVPAIGESGGRRNGPGLRTSNKNGLLGKSQAWQNQWYPMNFGR